MPAGPQEGCRICRAYRHDPFTMPDIAQLLSFRNGGAEDGGYSEIRWTYGVFRRSGQVMPVELTALRYLPRPGQRVREVRVRFVGKLYRDSEDRFKICGAEEDTHIAHLQMSGRHLNEMTPIRFGDVIRLTNVAICQTGIREYPLALALDDKAQMGVEDYRFSCESCKSQ